jgi:hypothetical protein
MSSQEIKPSTSGRAPMLRSLRASTPAPSPTRALASSDFSTHFASLSTAFGISKYEFSEIDIKKPTTNNGTKGGSFVGAAVDVEVDVAVDVAVASTPSM